MELEKLDNIEVQELDDQDLEDASGGREAEGNTNCGCNGNCGCGTENPSPVILV